MKTVLASNEGIVKAYLKKHAKTDIKPNGGMTALAAASKSRHQQVVEMVTTMNQEKGGRSTETKLMAQLP